MLSLHNVIPPHDNFVRNVILQNGTEKMERVEPPFETRKQP